VNRIVAAAALLAALHVLDAATLGARPGAGDQRRPTLILLVVLAAGALAYPRVRTGARAVLAALLGVLAAALGGVHLVEMSRFGLGTRDITAILALAGGIASLCAAGVMLWRSRRGDGRPFLRRALFAAAAVAAAYLLVVPAVLAVVVTHRPRDVWPTPAIGASVRLETSDGVSLAGRYVPPRNGAAVIVFPGQRGPRAAARMLVRHGYGVLLIDMRGTGSSGGSSNAFGWGSRADVAAGLDFLTRRGVRAIGGLGLSVGGELMLETAAYDRRLDAVVSEGAGFRTVHEAVRAGGATLPMDLVALSVVRALAPAAPPTPLDKLVGRIAPRPILLIRAGHGQGGEQLNDLYYRRAAEPKQLWTIPEAHHTGGLAARPREYERRVIGFFDRALLP
jgi:hypothetical protein